MAKNAGAVMPGIAAPVPRSAPIGIIDSLRGFGILKILSMNIPGFALPGAAGEDLMMLI